MKLLILFSLVSLALARTGFAEALTVSEIPNPSGAGAAEPHLATAADGRVVLSWLEPDGGKGGASMALRHAALEGNAFGQPLTVATGDNFFVNWADFPSVVPINDQLWAAHWLVQQPDSFYAYDVAIAVSNDAGNTWTQPLTPHNDGTPTEHGFVDLFPWKGGVGAVWLDGRNMTEEAAQHEAEAAQAGIENTEPIAGMTLRSALISGDGALVEESLVDPLVCDCCQTDVATGSLGPVLVYRNRTEKEVRDIYAAIAENGAWQPGNSVSNDGWEIPGCPVNGPAVAASGQLVVAAWFTVDEDVPRLRFARSRDGGLRFGTAIELDSGAPEGRVDVVLLEGGDAVVSWLRNTKPDQGELVIRRIPMKGSPGPIETVAIAGTGRPAGFPQMVNVGNRLVFAWTETLDDESTAVRTATVTLGSE